MTIQRRSVLKMLTLAPAYLYTRHIMGLTPAYSTRDGLPGGADINLVFHGFFFFDFQKDALVVGAPFHKDHNFGYRDKGEDDLHDMPQTAITFPQLKEGDPSTLRWPMAIMNFKKSDASLNVPLIPRQFSPDKLGSLMVLPYPKDIVPIRFGGTIDEFKLSGNIAKSINLPSDKQLGLITCLQYDKKSDLDFDTRHFYAEHCSAPGTKQLNASFDAARSGFGSPFKEKFDLTMTLGKLSPSDRAAYKPTKQRMAALDDDDYNDEAALRELRNVKHNPCKPFGTLADQSSGKAGQTQPQHHPKGTVVAALIRTANCPQFGML